MGPYFIDFEAFRNKNEQFILKELVMIDVDKPLTPLYYIFGPPKPWMCLDRSARRQYSFQTKMIHHLCWNEGGTRYCKECIWQHMKLSFPECDRRVCYVMGAEKMMFLKKEFPHLCLVEYNITFKTLPFLLSNVMCVLGRDHGEHCAYRKTLRLLQHYTDVSQ